MKILIETLDKVTDEFLDAKDFYYRFEALLRSKVLRRQEDVKMSYYS